MRSGHIFRVAMLALAVGATGCTPTEEPTVTRRATVTPTSAPPAAELQTVPCATANAGTAEFVALQSPAPRPIGAGEDEEPELDQGVSEPVPVDPNSTVLPLGELPVVPPPAAHDERQPEDVDDFGVTTVHVLTDWRSKTSETAEPSVAVNGRRVLMTWNHVASVSRDGGATFQFLFPLSGQPFASDDGGFCCDQIAHYVPSHDLWLWILQYEAGEHGRNRIRLAAAQGDDDFDAGRFRYWDFTPQDVGLGEGLTYDQTRLGTSNGHLFLSINTTDANNRVKGGVVLRLALEDLADFGAVKPDCLIAKSAEGEAMDSLSPVGRADDTMYLASHVTTSTLAVWRWPDVSAAPTYHLVRDVGDDNNWVAYPATQDAQGNRILYSCPVNDDPQADWCSRPARGGGTANDERIVTGWLSGGQIGWAWNAVQLGASVPYPWVFAIQIDESRLTSCELGGCVLGYPWLAFKDQAVQYPAIAPNANGDLGGVVVMGGGAHNLSCAAIVRDQYTGREQNENQLSSAWDVLQVAQSERAPFDASGDYLGIWPDGGNDLTWSGACMTHVNANPPTAIHFVRFGRKLNAPAD